MKRFPNIEWSGPAWYRVKVDEDGYPEEFKLVHFHPLDLGSSASTEWEAKDLASILKKSYEDHPSLKHCYIGLIHSHHTMGAFLSGTDTATVQEMAPEKGFYGSLVVASSGKATEAFGFGYKDQYKCSHCITIDESNIILKVPEQKVEDDWKEQADIIEKNKPAVTTKFGKQVGMFEGHKHMSATDKKKNAILASKTEKDQKKILKLIDKNSEGKLTDVDLEAKLESLGLDVTEIMYLTGEITSAYYDGYEYGGFYGRY